VLVDALATPALSVPVPICVEPSKNVTVPPGTPAPGDTAVTVAVNVTDWLIFDGFCDELTAVAVFALLTVCDNPFVLGL